MWFIFCIILIISYSYAENNINIAKDNNSLFNCINKIQYNYFKNQILIVSTINSDLNIYKNQSNTYTIFEYTGINLSIYPKGFWKFNYFIFLIKIPKDVKIILKALFETELWNSRGIYIIGYIGDNNVNEIFNICWEYYIYNIDVVTSLQSENKTGIFTYFPYKNNLCGQFENYELIQQCDDDIIEDLFPQKIPNNLNGCTVRLMAYPMIPYVLNIKAPGENAAKSGLEIIIMRVLSQRLNFTQKYIPHNHSFWGFKDSAGTYQFMFGSLFRRECELMLGMQFGNASHVIDFDGGFIHLFDSSVWWVPVALPIAQWKSLTTIFTGDVWLTILIVFIVNGVLYYLLGRINETSNTFNDIVLSLLTSLYSLLQGSVEAPKAWLLRIVFIIWLLACLLLYAAYQSQLISILTSQLYDHQISTLEEVVNSSLEYGMFVGAALAFMDPDNWIHRIVYKNYFPCPLSTYCLNRTAFQRGFACMRNLRNSRYFIPRYYTGKNGKILIYQMEGDALGIWVRFYTLKGFPLLDRINNLLMLLQSNGLIAKWDKDISFFVMKVESDSAHKALTTNHLQGAFFILVFGLSTAIFVFLSECIYKTYKLRTKYRKAAKRTPYLN